MNIKENSVSVEFIKSHVCFLYGKKTFCNSIPMKDKKGNLLPRRRYDIPLDYYEIYLANGWIKELDENPAKKKPAKATARKTAKKPIKKKVVKKATRKK